MTTEGFNPRDAYENLPYKPTRGITYKGYTDVAAAVKGGAYDEYLDQLIMLMVQHRKVLGLPPMQVRSPGAQKKAAKKTVEDAERPKIGSPAWHDAAGKAKPAKKIISKKKRVKKITGNSKIARVSRGAEEEEASTTTIRRAPTTQQMVSRYGANVSIDATDEGIWKYIANGSGEKYAFAQAGSIRPVASAATRGADDSKEFTWKGNIYRKADVMNKAFIVPDHYKVASIRGRMVICKGARSKVRIEFGIDPPPDSGTHKNRHEKKMPIFEQMSILEGILA